MIFNATLKMLPLQIAHASNTDVDLAFLLYRYTGQQSMLACTAISLLNRIEMRLRTDAFMACIYSFTRKEEKGKLNHFGLTAFEDIFKSLLFSAVVDFITRMLLTFGAVVSVYVFIFTR
uniref:Uncharacterized protein n=1 Tax=Glossina pallidipes TaxID=7398 RepID=A0A1A9ZM74_GLOPL